MAQSPEHRLAPSSTPVGELVPRGELAGRLDSFLLDRMDQGRPEFVVREVTPRLTWNRLDLAIKLFYLEQTETAPSDFAQELYDAHIHAFSLGDFREPGNSAKQDPASFRSAFRDIVISLRTGGFDPSKSLIPVASDGSFINGGHRAACAMFLHRNVHVVETCLPPVRYDYRSFRSRGLDDDLLEAAIVRYMERSPRARVALAWSGAASAFEALLGPLVYRKQLTLSPKGSANLLDMLDLEETTRLARADHDENHHRLTAFVLDLDDVGLPARLAQLPKEPRGQGSSMIHLLRSQKESLDVARLLLNDRSVRFLNGASPKRFPGTARLASDLRDILERSGVRTEDVLLDRGMLLATYGAKEATAADFISPAVVREAVTSANLVQQPSNADIVDILLDPRRHLHFGGLKFLGVSEAMNAARQRQTPNASDDLRLLASLRSRIEVKRPARALLYKARLYQSRLRRLAIHAVARLGLRAQAKAAYQALRRRPD
jgi:hypothetical protein